MKPILLATTFMVMAALLMFCSCEQINRSFEQTRNPRPEKTDAAMHTETESHSTSSSSSSTTTIVGSGSGDQSGNRSIFEDAATLDRIQSELEQLPQFRGKELMLYQSLHFYDFQGGRITINIQNPDTTENIDQYVYANGKWQEPTPVKTFGQLQQEVDFLMPLSRIRFATAKKINDVANEKIKDIPGGKTNGFIYFNCMRIKRLNKTDAGWYLQIQGARSDLRLDFDPDGNLKEMKKQ
ncbi:hypothetical protein LQ567_11415 [Niabella pedocola]|uniref:Beta-lactamase-inhibitor-like PepSY-like domain-containing protein n=1 Tax=Niabella pedocola TaxID=1752077 RepID=A0ABS8PQK5_9BACT|nr:hypothetical protein [Niabella pedocola]MCD2423372.1 hypothetical protein [Niabella pedocola]